MEEHEEETPVILDISSSTVRYPTSLHLDEQDESYFDENDQKLVNQFLDGEINFNDYIENLNIISKDEVPEEVVEDKVESSKKKFEPKTLKGGGGYR